MVVIRLARVGKKKQPEYRIVVADKRRAATGRFIDIIGHYNPLTDPAQVSIDSEKFMEWLTKGAQPSDTVRRLYDRDQKGEEIRNKPKKSKKAEAKAQAEATVAATDEAPAADEGVAETEPVTEESLEAPVEETPEGGGDVEAPSEEATPAPETEETTDAAPETEGEGA